MTKICYVEAKFQAKSLALIEHVNRFIDLFQDDGISPTLRQLYYQLVAADIIPNSLKSYKSMGATVSKARLAGLISWEGVTDGHRSHNSPYIQEDVDHAFSSLPYGLALDLWTGQENYVEVWVEKDALSNVIERPCEKWDVPYMACKGYMSSSEIWHASNRYRAARREGKSCHLIHLGDHDPSGLDMTRDNGARLRTMQSFVNVNRIALNRDQIDEYAPPPNPAKLTDARASEYIAEHGESSWELDALNPKVIRSLVDESIRELCDVDMWHARSNEQEEMREVLHKIAQNPESVMDFARESL